MLIKGGVQTIELLQVRKDFTAFHGSDQIKQKYLTRVREHRIADEIIQGKYYWKDGKGCAIGCTLHSSNHWCYEDELGVPNHLAYIQDELFEILPDDEAKMFPEQFLEAIAVGVDLHPALWKFMLFTLLDKANGLINVNENQKAIHETTDFYQRAIDGDEIPLAEFVSLREALLTPSELIVRNALDTLDSLDPQAAFRSLFTLHQLAALDFEARGNHGDWDLVQDIKRDQFVGARAIIWRDKLLECLSAA